MKNKKPFYFHRIIQIAQFLNFCRNDNSLLIHRFFGYFFILFIHKNLLAVIAILMDITRLGFANINILHAAKKV